MSLRGTRLDGAEVAQAVLAAVDDPSLKLPRSSANWLESWIEPVQSRVRFRRWLSNWLKAVLETIPTDTAARYFEEMANDLRQLDHDKAVDRLVDKVLPKHLSNDPKGIAAHHD